MIKLFKPEDFISITNHEVKCSVARTANAILSRELDKAPVVYGETAEEGFASYWSDSLLHQESGKKKGYLMFIEEIKKEPCKHSPYAVATQAFHHIDLDEVKCKHCGVKLKARWEAE